MNTIRQLLRVRSIVLATALVSLLLLAAMSTPASAQGQGNFVKNRMLSLSIGTAQDGSPAVIASMIGDYWSTIPAIAQPAFNAGLSVDGGQTSPGLPSVSVGLSSTPTTIIIAWAYPLSLMGRGTHTVTFSEQGTVRGASISGADYARFSLSLTVTVP